MLVLAVGAAALLVGTLLGTLHSFTLLLALAAALIILCLLVMRQDEMMGVILVVTAIVVDYYQLVQLPTYFPAVATVLGVFMLVVWFMAQSPSYPWVRIPYLWLWIPLIVLAALQLGNSQSFLGSVRYFITVLVNAGLAYMLGVQLGRDIVRFKRLVVFLAILAGTIAIHAIIQSQTGIFILLTPQWASWLNYKVNYTLFGTDTVRVGSFLINPDNLGTYMAFMLAILLGLSLVAKSRASRIAVLIGAAAASLALLLTYSTAAWLATGAGVLISILLVARGRSRAYLLALVVLVPILLTVLFPSAVQVLLAHATAPRELRLRFGAWETGLNIVRHFPLTGIGMGYDNYVARADIYRSSLQDTALTHPHNSYIEIAAVAGLPVAIAYYLLLGLAFSRGFKNFQLARKREQLLIGAVLASLIVLSVNSVATIGWTFPPLAILGWLLLGAVSSPSLTESLRSATESDTPVPIAPPTAPEVAAPAPAGGSA